MKYRNKIKQLNFIDAAYNMGIYFLISILFIGKYIF